MPLRPYGIEIIDRPACSLATRALNASWPSEADAHRTLANFFDRHEAFPLGAPALAVSVDEFDARQEVLRSEVSQPRIAGSVVSEVVEIRLDEYGDLL